MAWIATDENGSTYLYTEKPKREESGFIASDWLDIEENSVLLDLFEDFQFPKWEDEPIEIKITNNYILLS